MLSHFPLSAPLVQSLLDNLVKYSEKKIMNLKKKWDWITFLRGGIYL